MKLYGIIITLCSCLAITSFSVRAQQSRAQDSRPTTTIRIDTDLVMINVTATDKNGDYVRDLRADEFQVFEDGQRRKIDFFSVNDESTLTRPLAVVFALDLSGSLKPEEITTLHSAARKFTELMKGDSVFAALSFNDKVKVEQDFTSDVNKIEKAFARMNRFGGSTRLYDAVDKAVTMLDRRAPRFRKGRPLRHVVIVISDGFDSASIIDRRELIRRANAAGVTVYSITLPSYMLSPSKSTDRVITPFDASRIVPATGGKDFSANVSDFTPIFRALAEEIRASYALAYYPDVRDGKYRELRVATSRIGVQLRASRSGYTAPSK
jgi:Ca-activated chloride channel family protein